MRSKTFSTTGTTFYLRSSKRFRERTSITSRFVHPPTLQRRIHTTSIIARARIIIPIRLSLLSRQPCRHSFNDFDCRSTMACCLRFPEVATCRICCLISCRLSPSCSVPKLQCQPHIGANRSRHLSSCPHNHSNNIIQLRIRHSRRSIKDRNQELLMASRHSKGTANSS